jgi:hypothetical protein
VQGLRSIATPALLALLALLAALLGGCGHSTRSRADSAYERGDYETAATLYAHVVATEPGDADAHDRLQDARKRVLAASAAEIGRVRAAGRHEDALTLLARLLGRRRAWAFSGDASTQKATREHVAWADGYVRAEVGRFVASRMPLSGEALLGRWAPLLRDPDLATTQKDVAALVRASGQTACSDATAKVSVDTPFLAHRVGKLCAHYGAASPAQPKRPFLVSQVSTAGDVGGATPEDRERIAAAIQHGLEASVFWDAAAAAGPQVVAAGASTSGRNVARFSSRNTVLTRPWVESVPYEAIENYQEPYTETLPTTESYHESVPYTAYETRSRPCGTTTCTESYPVTKYRDEQRTRTVMRQQTAYRSRQRVVTRYRDENRIFTFEAREESAIYDTDVTVRIDVRQGLAPFAFQVSAHGSKSGFVHDASFPPAGVSPSRANLPTASAWLEGQIPAFEDQTRRAADAHFQRSFCERSAFTTEEAARCAHGTPALPGPARAVLAQALGADVDNILSL